MLAPAPALAHGGGVGGLNGDAAIWIAQLIFTAAWFAYAWGAAHVRPTGPRRLAFHAAMLIGGLALFGPLDHWAEGSTAWHMLQHMLLMVVMAPLAVLARPWPQWRAATRGWFDPAWRALARLVRRPMACALLHAAAIWAWHAPGPYMAAVFDPTLHVLEHASFVSTAALFWWSVFHAGRAGSLGALMALLFTLMHTGLLGAVLTFAREPLYWRESRELWDQQLAGLVMWIPGGAAYIAAAAWVIASALARQHRAPAARRWREAPP